MSIKEMNPSLCAECQLLGHCWKQATINDVDEAAANLAADSRIDKGILDEAKSKRKARVVEKFPGCTQK